MKKRDENYTLNEYNINKWPLVIDLLKKQKENEDNNLTRALNKINKEFRNKSTKNFTDIIFNKQKVELSVDFSISGNQSFICKKIIDKCNDKTEAIIEIGSGYGRNLFWTWLYGAPKNIKFFGLEFTESGRIAADTLASMEKGINYKSLSFNYYKPNFDFLSSIKGHVIFVTVHSIEQIPKLDIEFFKKIIELKNNVDCIHFEPIGWQIKPNKFKRGSSKQYAKMNDYNTNLFPLIQELQEKKLISIQEILPNFICINPKNGTSVLSWRPS